VVLHIRPVKAEGVLVSLKEVLVMAAKEVQFVVAGVEVRSGNFHLVGLLVHSCILRRRQEVYCLASPCQRQA